MATRKTTTRKTGNFSKRTTTISSRGLTQSYSSKPPGSPTRRTVSFNHKTGKTRTTYSTKLGGGWTKTSSKTTGGTKSRTSGSRSRRRSGGGGEGGEFIGALLLLIIVAPFWFCKKLWQAAEFTIKSEEKNFKYYMKVFGMFLVYLYLSALMVYLLFLLI